MSNYSGYVGFIKFQDPTITDGVIGARQSAEIILTFDSAVRNILLQIEPNLLNVEFDLPIKVRAGSWEALIPQTVAEWLTTAAGVYITTAAGVIAKNDFKNKNFADITRTSVRLLQGVIRIAKHVGKLGKKDIGAGIKFKDNNSKIEIPNAEGVVITTTRDELNAYLRTPSRMLKEIADYLGKNSSFSVGEVTKSGNIHEETIYYADREVFSEDDEEPDNIVLPELKHDDYVILEGSMTRGNKITNTIGFKYEDHILTCIPAGAPITAFREAFFRDCKIGGRISRLNEAGETTAKRPKIIFDQLEPVEPNNLQISLL